MRVLKIITPIITVVAIAALAVAVVGLLRPQKSYTGQFARLRAEVAAQTAHMASQSREISSLQSDSQAGAVADLRAKLTSSQSVVSQLQNTVAAFKICVPELEQQINDTSVQTSDTNGFLTGAYLQDPAIISTNCTKMLNGS